MSDLSRRAVQFEREGCQERRRFAKTKNDRAKKSDRRTLGAGTGSVVSAQCVSACSDGSAIIWDLATFHRRAELTANTFFKACAYHPDESQIVTTGTDRKVSWWEAFDGSAIRVVDGSETAEINSLDVSSDGTQVVTGGGDKEGAHDVAKMEAREALRDISADGGGGGALVS